MEKLKFICMVIFVAVIVCFCFISCRKQKNETTTKTKIYEVDLSSKTAETFFKDPKIIELCKAMSNNNEKRVEALLDEGFNINTNGKDGMSPLYWALKTKNKRMFLLLLQKGAANLNRKTYKGNTVLNELKAMKDAEYLEIAKNYTISLEQQKNYRETPMHEAIMSISLEKVKKLVQEGANINHQDLVGDTPMIVAAKPNQYQIVYYLLEAGADPQLRNRMGLSIVYYIKNSYATMAHDGMRYDYLLKTVELLKKQGVEIDLSEPFDRSKRQ